MYKTDHSAVFYRTAEDFYEFAMAHRVEEAFKVKVHYIYVAIVDYPLRSTKCVMASSSRSEAVARHGELVLIDGNQYLVYGLLVLSVQTYKAICLIPQVYRVSLKKEDCLL